MFTPSRESTVAQTKSGLVSVDLYKIWKQKNGHVTLMTVRSHWTHAFPMEELEFAARPMSSGFGINLFELLATTTMELYSWMIHSETPQFSSDPATERPKNHVLSTFTHVFRHKNYCRVFCLFAAKILVETATLYAIDNLAEERERENVENNQIKWAIAYFVWIKKISLTFF